MPAISELAAASEMLPLWGWIALSAVAIWLLVGSQGVSSVSRLVATVSLRLQLLSGSAAVGVALGLTVPPESLPLVGGLL